MQERVEDSSSEELARGAQAGSPACFAELVRRHERALYNFLRLRTRTAEDAEELAQDAFVRAWRKIATYRDEWKFATWLFAVARRVAASRLRAIARASGSHGSHEDLDRIGVECDPALPLGTEEERVRIWELAARVLSADQRSALWLRYAEDLAVEEIGRVLRRRPAAVRALLFRARETLARNLAHIAHLESGPARQSARAVARPATLTRPSATP